MKIVIDIPEGMLDELHTCKFPIQEAYRLCLVIENGKPLPKGHGRLIDKDKMIRDLLTVDEQYETDVDFCLSVIESYDVIVEADKEGAE